MRRSQAFQILGVEARFDLSSRDLRAAWMRRAAVAHPDAAGAVDESARVNDAMRVLSDPIQRAQALLELRGAPAVDGRAMPQEFLLEMMELRERADACAGDAEATARLRDEAASRRDAAVAEIARLFADSRSGALDAAVAELVIGRINVIRAFERMMEQLDRESAGGSAAP
ncbi:MAG: putative co-chaperone, DnaJ family [Planctomycetota bacterium]|jgi:curved DNA-binding protein CbpA